ARAHEPRAHACQEYPTSKLSTVSPVGTRPRRQDNPLALTVPPSRNSPAILSRPAGTGACIRAAAAGPPAARLPVERPPAWTGVIAMASSSPAVSAITGAADIFAMAVLLEALPE